MNMNMRIEYIARHTILCNLRLSAVNIAQKCIGWSDDVDDVVDKVDEGGEDGHTQFIENIIRI